MGKVVVVNNVTLDGVMQAPGRADEDTRDGFEYGGWATMPNEDPVIGQAMGDRMATSGPMLFGRRTYEDFAGFWPRQTDNPFTEVLNNTRKYVASTTLSEPLPWANSTLLGGDVPAAVARLKEEHEKNIAVLGSGVLIQSLMERDVIDEYVLLIHPIVLGQGRRLFADGVPPRDLRLADTVTSSTGVIVATYQRS